MTTPCIVASGDRHAWRGVPCKADGDPSSAGVVIVDHLLRHGIEATIEALVARAPFGWDAVGGDALVEPDEFLGGTALDVSTPHEILGRHYAIYVIDASARRLDVYLPADAQWLEPLELADDGTLIRLPAWYPQPPAHAAKRRRPAAITEQLQAQCLERGLRWASVTAALQRWCDLQLGDLTGCEWLYLTGGSTEHVRCLIGETWVYAATDACLGGFVSSDGLVRSISVDDIELAEQIFGELAIGSSHALPVVQRWLSLAYELGSGRAGACVSWLAGARRWDFLVPSGTYRSSTVVESDLAPMGWLPTLLCWLH